MTDRETGPLSPGHLNPEQLDDLARGTGDATTRGHLGTCPACRSALAEQEAVRRVLLQVPDPGPMPDDVVSRLDAALAGASTADRAEPVNLVPLHPAAHRAGVLGRLAESRLTKSLVAAAAVGLIAVGGYAAIHRNQPGSGGGSSAASSAGDSAGGAKAAPQQLAQFQVEASGTAYTTAAIATQVASRLSLALTARHPQGATAPGADGPLTTPAGLQACLRAIEAPASSVPQLVDLATFDGKPAAVIVLPRAGGGREIWVVSRTCAPGADGTVYTGFVK